MSFWENFCNIFNLFPQKKTYQQLSDELDERMQKLYSDNGWGEYANPLKTCAYPAPNPAYNTALDINSQCGSMPMTPLYTDPKEFLEEMLKQVPSGPFVPYCYYNEDMDAIQVYFKNDESYTQPLNEAMELMLSFDKEEIVGVNIINIKKLLKEQILP